MLGFIIWIVGIVATVYVILDIFKKNIPTPCKWIISLVVLITNWIGLVVYWFLAKDRIEEWCNK